MAAENEKGATRGGPSGNAPEVGVSSKPSSSGGAEPSAPEPPEPLFRVVADSASMQGRFEKQEDRHVKIPDLTKAAKALKMPIDHLDQPCSFFAVYDGHQGPLCADFAAKGFHGKLLKKLSAETSSSAWTDERLCGALAEVCEELDKEFLQKHRTSLDGCTLVVALITGLRLSVAWVGNSRCILGNRGTSPGNIHTVPLTEDHSPSILEEAERIKEAGGVVFDYGNGFARVAHDGYEERLREMQRAQVQGLGVIGKAPVALDVSRALGDRNFKAVSGNKALLVPTAGVRSVNLDSACKFLALVCGGVPAVMLNEEVAEELDLLQDKSDLGADVRAGCGALVQEAYKRGSSENLTVILVRFQWPGASDKSYIRKTASIEKAKRAAAAVMPSAGIEGKAESAAAASKRRRLEVAASVDAQKAAAYQRAVSTKEAAASNAAEAAKKNAEMAKMKAEVEAEMAEVARKEREAQREAARKAAETEDAGEGGPGLDAAEAFFAARRATRATEAEAKKGTHAATAETSKGSAGSAGSGASDAAATATPGLDAAEAFFAARRAKKEAEGAAGDPGAPVESKGLDAAEAFFEARRAKKEAEKKEEKLLEAPGDGAGPGQAKEKEAAATPGAAPPLASGPDLASALETKKDEEKPNDDSAGGDLVFL